MGKLLKMPPAGAPETGLETVDVQREAMRDSLFLQVQLRACDGSEEFVGRVRNLSAGGMMIEAPVIPEVGARYEIELRGIGQIGGVVAWTVEGRLGFAFDEAIDPKAARVPVSGTATAAAAKPASLRKPIGKR